MYTDFYLGCDALAERKCVKATVLLEKPLDCRQAYNWAAVPQPLWAVSLGFHVTAWTSRTAGKAGLWDLDRP